MDPGPIDPSVLYHQELHRSNLVWETGVEKHLQTRNYNQVRQVDARVQRYLYLSGFYGVYHLGFSRIDRPLITALVERWRPETHTFHLPTGECTITLQDVEIICGLPVDGDAIISDHCRFKKDDWRVLVTQLIGEDPGNAVKGGLLKMRWLKNRVSNNPLPDNADDEAVRRHTRATIMLLLGGQYMVDKSGDCVKLRYLPFLRDLEACKNYSWGSAILAVMYRELCGAAYGNSDIAGPLILLQLWTWIRFPCIRHIHIQSLADLPEPDDPAFPDYTYGYRWIYATRAYDPEVIGHNTRHFRNEFDQMRDEQIVWEPYVDILNLLPEYCTVGEVIWRARVPLICFEMVEHYYPDRVLRQFGKRQGIPPPCLRNDALHDETGKGNSKAKWASKHQEFVEQWHQARTVIPMMSTVDHRITSSLIRSLSPRMYLVE